MNEFAHFNKVRTKTGISNKRLLWTCHFAIGLILLFFISSGTAASEDKVLATVNGEPIYESQVSEGIPYDTFDFAAKQAKMEKLDRLIENMIIRQFLEKEHIHICPKKIDEGIEQLKKTPPAAGCMCCRYPSLDFFMSVNYYTMPELRKEIANGIGIGNYLDTKWQQRYPLDADRKALAKRERKKFEKDYIKVWHIFFNTFQQEEFSMKPELVKKKTNAKAQEVWTRIKNGEDFEKLAAEVSDDAMSKTDGGFLGCIRIDTFGNLLKDARKTLKDGEYNEPMESMFGFHIIKIQAIDENDILDMLKTDYVSQEAEKLFTEIKEKAKIVKHVDQ
ncbi:MAG: peptidylprolyl isomerase [Proteobacteria bacterium]|nr:peptidylprolyl isomerase [Pseudomonadota bacterium]